MSSSGLWINGFRELLGEATRAIGNLYFQLPVAGRENPVYRERVYCYELYHQLRMCWPTNWEYRLSGEVDKSGHPMIRNNLLDNIKPDFLVHVPGEMESNMLVMEVKPVNAQRKNIKKDLRTLTAFLRHGEYENAIFLTYGGGEHGGLQGIRNTGQSCAIEDRDHIDLTTIELWYHQSVGIAAKRHDWSG